jgi:hypothetical protein
MGLYLNGYSQAGKRFTISLIGKIPLIVESGFYIDSLVNQTTLIVVSGKVRIGLTPRKQKMATDQYLVAGKPLSASIYPLIEYRYFYVGQPGPNWTSLPLSENKSLQDNPVAIPVWLSEETIPDNSILKLQFRFKDADTLLQETLFKKQGLNPEITGYRFHKTFDSIGNNLKSLAIKKTKKQPKGFTKMTTDLLVAPAGQIIEILIQKRGLNADSCIEYRLINTREPSDRTWRISGHLLSFTGLRSNSDDLLDLRYIGSNIVKRYRLQTAPFWYEQKGARFIIAFMGLSAFAIIPYMAYKRKLRKEITQRKQAEEQLRMVQSQLNPHFVFNALSTIESLVTNKENERANEYLSTFSDIMRDTLKNSRILSVSLADDMVMLERYLSVEQLRFGFRFVIEIDPQIDTDLIEFPPMLLQPSIENAVKHGVSALGPEGIITLRYSKRENDLMIQIIDNGKKGIRQQSRGNGLGICFTKERIGNLQKLYKKEHLNYQIRATDKGTIVNFHFQNWLAR